MGKKSRRRYDPDFIEGAVSLVTETGRTVASVAREVGVHAGTLGRWVREHQLDGQPLELSESERAELARLRKENSQLRVQRDVLKRSVVLWVDEAMGRKP